MLEVCRHIESNGRNLMVWLRFLYQFKFQMLSSGADLSAVSVVIDILGQENRGAVTRSERLELLQDSENLGVIWAKLISESTSTTGVAISVVMCELTYLSMRAVNSGRFSSFIVNPAA